MDKKIKVKLSYITIFIFVFIVPHLFLYYFNKSNTELFYEWLNEDHEVCLQRAERDSTETRWCDEIRNAARHTFSSTGGYFNSYLLIVLYQPILFVLLLSVRNLTKQVKELKEKIDA